jgi:peptidoglycan hydrolase CwlO-like protein
MIDSHRRWITSRILPTVCVLFLTPALAKCLEAQNAAPSNASSSTAELTSEVHALTDTVRELQAQVQSLQSQLTELSAKDQGGDTGAHASGK